MNPLSLPPFCASSSSPPTPTTPLFLSYIRPYCKHLCEAHKPRVILVVKHRPPRNPPHFLAPCIDSKAPSPPDSCFLSSNFAPPNHGARRAMLRARTPALFNACTVFCCYDLSKGNGITIAAAERGEGKGSEKRGALGALGKVIGSCQSARPFCVAGKETTISFSHEFGAHI